MYVTGSLYHPVSINDGFLCCEATTAGIRLNGTPYQKVLYPSLNSFKNRLDKFWIKYKFSEDPPQIKSHYSTEDVTSDNEDQSTG